MVSGVGYDRAKKVGGFIAKRHDLRRVVTNLAVLDFNSPDNSMRLVSVHPGVSVDDVVANTGFELVIPANVPVSRPPTAQESAAIEAIDPKGLRHREIPA
jgi:acyl CoA:acetate/3-ketoacid CoA transferase beta subunit